MQPEQAAFLREVFLPGIENEFQTTKKVIAAIPQAKCGYKPDPKSRAAIDLAWHIAITDLWFLEGLIKGEFTMEEPKIAQPKTIAEILSIYEKEFPALVAKVKALPPAKLAQTINFLNFANHPAVIYLQFLNNHSVHHRGQLAAYLRPMGSKVPSIYGGSADEPLQMSAS